MNQREVYELGASMTFVLVKEWFEKTAELPRFAYPPKDVALLVDLRDFGQQLACNDSARALVDHLITCVVAATGHAPTTMMLRVVLQVLEVPIEWVSPSELGLKVPTS